MIKDNIRYGRIIDPRGEAIAWRSLLLARVYFYRNPCAGRARARARGQSRSSHLGKTVNRITRASSIGRVISLTISTER